MANLMKKTIITVAILGILALVGMAQSVKASTLSDDFNDGNANGWTSFGLPNLGNWRVENNEILQDLGGDNYSFLLKYTLSNQSIETKILMNDTGAGGIMVWHKDDNNWAFVMLRPRYEGEVLAILERINGEFRFYGYPLEVLERTWYTLRVDANSLTGELAIYLNDTYLMTQALTTTNRGGLSGYISGNAGGRFDDFRVTSDDLPFKIDINSGHDPNKINLNSKDKVTVAVLSTQNFDANSEIDPTTVTFAGARVASKAKNGTGDLMVSIKDVNEDGLLDMVLEFDIQSLQLNSNSTMAVLRGKTFDGMTIMVTDAVQVLPKAK